jgi:hypothetical protein
MDDRTLPVSDNDYDLLNEVRVANGWSAGEAAHRAIHAIWALDQHLKAVEDRHAGDAGQLIARLRRELNPPFLVSSKPMRKIESYDDRPIRIRIDDFMFHEVDGALLSTRIRDLGDEDRLGIYEVFDGRLDLRHSGPYSGPPAPEGVEMT